MCAFERTVCLVHLPHVIVQIGLNVESEIALVAFVFPFLLVNHFKVSFDITPGFECLVTNWTREISLSFVYCRNVVLQVLFAS